MRTVQLTALRASATRLLSLLVSFLVEFHVNKSRSCHISLFGVWDSQNRLGTLHVKGSRVYACGAAASNHGL